MDFVDFALIFCARFWAFADFGAVLILVRLRGATLTCDALLRGADLTACDVDSAFVDSTANSSFIDSMADSASMTS